MQNGDIIVRDKSRSTEIKYRIVKVVSTCGVELVLGYRVKWDKRSQEWVGFGNMHTLLEKDYRLFTIDDYHYIK